MRAHSVQELDGVHSVYCSLCHSFCRLALLPTCPRFIVSDQKVELSISDTMVWSPTNNSDWKIHCVTVFTLLRSAACNTMYPVILSVVIKCIFTFVSTYYVLDQVLEVLVATLTYPELLVQTSMWSQLDQSIAQRRQWHVSSRQNEIKFLDTE